MDCKNPLSVCVVKLSWLIYRNEPSIYRDGPRVSFPAWESIQVSRMVHVVDIRCWRQGTTRDAH